MTVEAVLLTGGKSTRMGVDKASLLVDGEPCAERIRRLLSEQKISVTILGPGGEPDQFPNGGPLLALFAFMPTLPNTFICSCDLPAFDPRLPIFLEEKIGEFDAAIPEIDGKLQFLCGCYARSAFFALHDAVINGARSLWLWAEELKIRKVEVQEFIEAGIDPLACLGANTPEEWKARVETSSKPYVPIQVVMLEDLEQD